MTSHSKHLRSLILMSAAALEQKNVIQDANISHVSDRLTGVESMAGMGPSTTVDGQTANLIQQSDTLTKAALSAVIVQRTFLIDQDYASLEHALLALAPGGVMEVRRQHSRAFALNVDKACMIRFTHSGSITAGPWHPVHALGGNEIWDDQRHRNKHPKHDCDYCDSYVEGVHE